MSASKASKEWHSTSNSTDINDINHVDSAASAFPRAPTTPKWQSFLFPCIAATVAAPFTNPCGVAKIQLQAQKGTGSARKYRGMFDFWRKAAYSSEGFAILRRGTVPVMMREASLNTFRIGLYDPILSLINEDGVVAPAWKRMVAGAVSGAVGAFVSNPFEIVRVKVQAQNLESSAGPRHFCSQMLQKDGVPGFYKAAGVSMVLMMACSSVNLTIYTLLRETATQRFQMDDGPLVDASSALVSGFFATLAMNPLDVLRTRLMTQPSPSPYRSSIDAALHIARTEGAAAFLKGFIPSFLRIGPHFGLTFLLLEQMRRFARSYNANKEQYAYLTAPIGETGSTHRGETIAGFGRPNVVGSG